jgi:fimbrial chaperone protein
MSKAVICVLFCILWVTTPILGFQVDFPKATFDVFGQGKTRSLIVMNKGENLLAVEIAMARRTIDSDGNESLGEPSSDFDIYPTQLLINPGEDANVTLVWKGTTVPNYELAYRIESKEIPFNDASQVKIGSVQFLVGRRYLTAAYVTPPGAKPNVRLHSLVPSTNGTQKELVVTVENVGTAHKIVANFSVNVTHRVDGGRDIPLSVPVTLTDPQFRQKFNILVDGKRAFTIPWPATLPFGSLKGVLSHVE